MRDHVAASHASEKTRLELLRVRGEVMSLTRAGFHAKRGGLSKDSEIVRGIETVLDIKVSRLRELYDAAQKEGREFKKNG